MNQSDPSGIGEGGVVPKASAIDPRTLKVPKAPAKAPQPPAQPADKAEPQEKVAAPEAAPTSTRLDRYGLSDSSEELKANAVAAEPFLGKMALRGQHTWIFAPSGAGKTLVTIYLLKQGAAQRASMKVYYVNMDDNGYGLAVKNDLFNAMGVTMIAPGWKGFNSSELLSLVEGMVDGGECGNTAIILDTAKKVVDLMDKKLMSRYGDIIRKYTAAGGTLISIAHTNKNKSRSGKNVYGGVSDSVNDSDAAYIADVTKEGPKDRVVTFEKKKGRGINPERISFTYDATPTDDYEHIFGSVRQLDDAEASRLHRKQELMDDQSVIEAIRACIEKRVTAKMEIAKAVSKETKVSRDKVVAIIEKYTGADEERHIWNYFTAQNNRHEYYLLDDDRF